MKVNWHDINDSLPEDDDWYLVEIQECDIPDQRDIRCEWFGGSFESAQFVNKWAAIEDWIKSDFCMPPENVGVLVYIPDEDDHMTAGMWDVSHKWVLLDEYREPDCAITHWRMLPKKPKIKHR